MQALTAAPQLPAIDIEHHCIGIDGQTFYCAAAGPKDGPPVLLLHGFPEMSYGWRHQIPALAAAGLRVIVPDQRGYGHSSKPAGVQAYRLDTLADDVVAIARHFGHRRFALVGHDWGGIVAWQLAARHDGPVERLAILNAPRLSVMSRYVLRHRTQLLMSSYVAAFQLPGLAELALAGAGHALMRAALTRSSRPGTFSKAELDVYEQAWSEPGALTAMLNWYRALRLYRDDRSARIGVPTLIPVGRSRCRAAARNRRGLCQPVRSRRGAAPARRDPLAAPRSRRSRQRRLARVPRLKRRCAWTPARSIRRPDRFIEKSAQPFGQNQFTHAKRWATLTATTGETSDGRDCRG